MEGVVGGNDQGWKKNTQKTNQPNKKYSGLGLLEQTEEGDGEGVEGICKEVIPMTDFWFKWVGKELMSSLGAVKGW